MFLLNSCLGRFSAAALAALLLPKLRSHFAEFLNNASPVGLRILSSSTCVGLRYGSVQYNSSFSRRLAHLLRYPLVRSTSRIPLVVGGFASPPGTSLVPVFPFPGQALHPCPYSSDCTEYRNLYLLSIDYGFRPRLRSRLTQSRSALLWKP